MKKRIVAFLLVLCTVFALFPANVFAASTVNTFTITMSAPVGGQFPPYDAAEPDDFSSYVQYVRWTGSFDEYGRCKSGETYKAYITVRIKDGLNKTIEHVAKYVTVNGELAKMNSISSDKKEAVITYSFTAASGSPAPLTLESVSSFKEGDCGYAEVTGNSYSYLRATPNYSDFNAMTSPTVWEGETLLILYANIANGFHAVLYNGKCYYYYDPVHTFVTNEQCFGNNKPVPAPKEEAEPKPTVKIINYTGHVAFSAEYNKEPQYTLPTSEKYTCTAVCEPAKKPYDFSRLYVTFTPNEGYAFAEEGVFAPYSIDVVENVEHLSDGSVRLTYVTLTGAGDAAIGPTDQMIAYHEAYGETYRPDTVAIATIYDPTSRVDRDEVPVYDYPVTGTREDVSNYGKKKYTTGDKVYIMELNVEDFFEGTVGEWVRLTDGKYLQAAYLSDIQYTDNWVGTPGKRVDSDFAFAGGSGTKEDPYLIETAEQLNAVRKGLCYHYKLIADIDLSKWGNWIPLGATPAYAGRNRWADGERGATFFIGSFDGNGHVVSGMTINIEEAQPFKNSSVDDRHYGLFAVISNLDDNASESNPNVWDLGIVNYTINLRYTDLTNELNVLCGALAGETACAYIKNCYSAGGKVNIFLDGEANGNAFIGGLIGDAGSSCIYDCYNTSDLTVVAPKVANKTNYDLETMDSTDCGFVRMGGIVAQMTESHIYRCFNTGTITAPIMNSIYYWGWTECYIGGIVAGAFISEIPAIYGLTTPGWAFNDIWDCYNTGKLIGNTVSGILVFTTADCHVIRCYNTGELVANTVDVNYPHKSQIVSEYSAITEYGSTYIRNCYSNGTSVSGDAWQNSSTLGRKVLKSNPEEGTKTVRPIVVAQIGGFKDVKANDWYGPAVEWAVRTGITNGTGDGTVFSPTWTCTRAQILTFLWRAVGSPEPTIANPYTDVATWNYYYKAALWAYEQGMVTGNLFAGESTPCTRASTVIYLWQYVGSPKTTPTNEFSDVPSNSEYAQAVAWAVANGVTTGTGNGMFSPDRTCTRAEIVTFLLRAVK